MLLVFAMVIPAVFGLLMPLLNKCHRGLRIGLSLGAQGLTLACAVLLFFKPQAFSLWTLSPMLTISFAADGLGCLFATLICLTWVLVSIFSIKYMGHYTSSRESQYMTFCLLTQSALLSMCYADNMFAMYLSFELVTLCSVPLVLQDRTPESIKGALKYLFYSIAGGFVVLIGMFLFLSGGNDYLLFKNTTFVHYIRFATTPKSLVGVFLMCLGFGAKAGMYPMHGWLPSAHPVAPAPASAVLSGLVAKAGVLGIIRVLFYLAQPNFVFGTWVQGALLSLALFTVFMGSMMAYREPVLKKRLAYSTVSQISYALVGIFMLNSTALSGALFQVILHAIVKICLFLAAGAVIHSTGKTQVDELTGIGKAMPMTMLCYTLASLSLIGIPPTGGFVAKLQLCYSAMTTTSLGAFSWLIPVVLIVSAILTAGYLLPVSIKAFFPGKDFVSGEDRQGRDSKTMWIPMLILVILAFVLGMICEQLQSVINIAVTDILR